jgi:hypothetical protein
MRHQPVGAVFVGQAAHFAAIARGTAAVGNQAGRAVIQREHLVGRAGTVDDACNADDRANFSAQLGIIRQCGDRIGHTFGVGDDHQREFRHRCQLPGDVRLDDGRVGLGARAPFDRRVADTIAHAAKVRDGVAKRRDARQAFAEQPTDDHDVHWRGAGRRRCRHRRLIRKTPQPLIAAGAERKVARHQRTEDGTEFGAAVGLDGRGLGRRRPRMRRRAQHDRRGQPNQS